MMSSFHGQRIMLIWIAAYESGRTVSRRIPNYRQNSIWRIDKRSLTCQVKLSVDGPIDITSVMTLDTLADLGVKKGDTVRVIA